ncbi:M28 family peptidase [candidate division GN15 bacterium]|nr:M28 family peptidase [candidate division GN15 bacterium]
MLSRLMITLAVLLLAGSALGADLFFVQVNNQQEARALDTEQIEPIARLSDGYLVLAEGIPAERLAQGLLKATLVVSGIDKEELALDGRMDRANVDRYQLLFERDDFRLFRIHPTDLIADDYPTGLVPIRNEYLRITWDEPTQLRSREAADMVDLDSLISLVNQDSLQSYTERLQAFLERVSGTDSSAAARDWIADQLTNYGYDSVVFDTFAAHVGGSHTVCENVIAYKIGTRFPAQQIVIGAHRDAVHYSPGADDNGSGTAGVLEMARVLKDIETDMTFIFCLFDAEEWGLYGSYHYAEDARARGDSIILMFNMDMIGYYENTDQATVHHGDDTTFAQVFQDLADSLVGISGWLAGTSPSSDHYPFQQNGFDVTYIQEAIFSSVYHSPNDSTTYMSFDYMTRMVKGGLATVYTVSQTAGPLPTLIFDFPSGLPGNIPPGDTVKFDVTVATAWEGEHVQGSGQLHYRIDGGVWQSKPMAVTGTHSYEAALPVVPCQSIVDYYISVDEATVGPYTSGDSTYPYDAVGADALIAPLDDDFETDLGWIVSGDAYDGMWERGVPWGNSDAYGGGGDPKSDFDGSGQCYVTGNEEHADVDNGTTYLTSPIINLDGATQARISYARWFHNNFSWGNFDDSMMVWISNNGGGSFTLVEVIGPTDQCSGGWYINDFWVSDYIAPTANMRLRFEAADLGTRSGVEAAVDAVLVEVFECDEDIYHITNDSLPDWTVDIPYSWPLQAIGGEGDYTWHDKHGDLSGTGLALDSSGVLSGTPLDTGQISFVAVVTDQADSSIEKALAFVINPELLLDTETVPGGDAGQPYSFQLRASGGTPPLQFSDMHDDLAGTGLTVDSSGLITGTPQYGGDYFFTAHVVDAVGDSDERLLEIVVNQDYICGDVNGDGAGPSVLDLTYLVEYLFGNGPAPPNPDAADINDDDSINVQDLTWQVLYLFQGGPPPQC